MLTNALVFGQNQPTVKCKLIIKQSRTVQSHTNTRDGNIYIKKIRSSNRLSYRLHIGFDVYC